MELFEIDEEAYNIVKKACREQLVLRYYDVSNVVTLLVDTNVSGLEVVCLREK